VRLKKGLPEQGKKDTLHKDRMDAFGLLFLHGFTAQIKFDFCKTHISSTIQCLK
jgi:hypothetical protein